MASSETARNPDPEGTGVKLSLKINRDPPSKKNKGRPDNDRKDKDKLIRRKKRERSLKKNKNQDPAVGREAAKVDGEVVDLRVAAGAAIIPPQTRKMTIKEIISPSKHWRQSFQNGVSGQIKHFQKIKKPSKCADNTIALLS